MSTVIFRPRPRFCEGDAGVTAEEIIAGESQKAENEAIYLVGLGVSAGALADPDLDEIASLLGAYCETVDMLALESEPLDVALVPGVSCLLLVLCSQSLQRTARACSVFE